MTRFILKELSRYDCGTYAEIIFRNAVYYPDREAFRCEERRVSFRDFNSGVNRLVSSLRRLGLEKGDVIGVLSWNCLEYPYVYGAAMKGGFVVAPFNARLTADELQRLIRYSQAKAVFVGSEFLEVAARLKAALPAVGHWISLDSGPDWLLSHRALLDASYDEEPSEKVDPEAPLFLFFTSGTTGDPRGGLYTHARAIEDTKTYVMMTGIQPTSRFLMIMPFFHIGGAKLFWSYFYVGASQVIMESFDAPATLTVIQEQAITDIHIVPTHLTAFFSVPRIETYDLKSLKRVFYAASPMPVELLKRGLQLWGPIFSQGYGSTETGPNVCCLRPEEHRIDEASPGAEKVLLSCGRADLGVQVRIVDETGEDLPPGEAGEIVVRGNTMIEYWRKPEETATTMRNGWTYTGDMGYYDDLGYIYIVDRKKDMIVSGGENVYPREVEEVLYQHPDVKEAAVFGLPDPYWVERVHALVVPKVAGTLSEEELIGFCKSRIAGYKVPKSVELVDALPKNAAGKILKRKLREERAARGRR